jgi:hypothetical protein
MGLREMVRMVADPKFGSSWGGWCFNEPLGVWLWKNIRKDCGSFQVMPDLRWEMAPRLDFDMIYGVEI